MTLQEELAQLDKSIDSLKSAVATIGDKNTRKRIMNALDGLTKTRLGMSPNSKNTSNSVAFWSGAFAVIIVATLSLGVFWHMKENKR